VYARLVSTGDISRHSPIHTYQQWRGRRLAIRLCLNRIYCSERCRRFPLCWHMPSGMCHGYSASDVISVTNLCCSLLSRFFTARCYASAVLAIWACVRVCHNFTSRCSTKTVKRRITQTTPDDSPSSFLTPKISAKFYRGKPYVIENVCSNSKMLNVTFLRFEKTLKP